MPRRLVTMLLFKGYWLCYDSRCSMLAQCHLYPLHKVGIYPFYHRLSCISRGWYVTPEDWYCYRVKQSSSPAHHWSLSLNRLSNPV